MTNIVKNTTRIVAGFAAVIGIFIALSGHFGPGGGFAGGVIVSASGILIILAFGKDALRRRFRRSRCEVVQAGGAVAFVVLALLGFAAGEFFLNFLQPHCQDFESEMLSGGTILLADLAIFLSVGAGLVGVFLAVAPLGAGRGNRLRSGSPVVGVRDEATLIGSPGGCRPDGPATRESAADSTGRTGAAGAMVAVLAEYGVDEAEVEVAGVLACVIGAYAVLRHVVRRKEFPTP